MSAAGPLFHVGLGRLGLGFVVPLLAENAAIVGFHRAASDSEHYAVLGGALRYTRVDSQTALRQTYAFNGVVPYGAEGFLDAAKIYGPPLAVTCAIKAGVPEVYPLLCNLVESYRDTYRDRPLLFVPFENARDVGSDAVAYVRNRVRDSEALFIGVDSVVDKVCSAIGVVDGGCFVRAEGSEHLAIGIPPDVEEGAARDALASLDLERFVIERPLFDFEVRKKAWIVNGLHYCIAMTVLERDLDYTSVPDALADPLVAGAALQFTREMAVALEVYAAEHDLPFPAEAIDDFIADVVLRMRTAPDQIPRIFGPIVNLHRLLAIVGKNIVTGADPIFFGDVFRKWSERIAEPAEIVLRYHRHLDGPLVSPQLSLFLLKWLGDYVSQLTARP